MISQFKFISIRTISKWKKLNKTKDIDDIIQYMYIYLNK